MKKIKIIGCGVSGLTVGVLLLEEGYNVEIITDKLPKATTSSKAAAIWFPYEVKPVDKASVWSKISYNKFKELSTVSNSGVSMISLTVLIKKEEDAWWKDTIPKSEIKKATLDELPPKFPLGYIMNVPLAETQLYLEFLFKRFKKLGGNICIQKVETLKIFKSSHTIVINCTGLGSRELVNDKQLYPIHGQIVKAQPKTKINCIAADFTFGETADRLAYIVPRKDCLVLGGTAIKGEENTIPNKEFTKEILKRCKTIEPNLKDVKVKSVEVGLRPGRPSIRLEIEGNVIHNYGHGGGGFTVSWGCAESVKELIKQIK